MISANLVDVDTYTVQVEGDIDTEHRIHMTQRYYQVLCKGQITHEWVLIQSIKFLLEREANTSILPEFDLEQVNAYFPEFEEEMIRRLNQA